jgi:hypothetical protein
MPGPETPSVRPVGTPSFVILGTDAIAAALPYTAIQLAHGCMAAGYDLAVPASWGDELLAAAALELIGTQPAGEAAPVIVTACPRVAGRIGGGALDPFLIRMVSPPVATARYLRAVYAPAAIEVTYAGRCPGVVGDSIDERVAPEALIETMESRGIFLREQPTFFESVIPPDRRRHLSLPGGIPDPAILMERGVELVRVDSANLATSLAQRLLSGGATLIDPAPALGCSCAGEGCGLGTPGAAAGAIESLEPPRSRTPVVDQRVRLELLLQKPEHPAMPAEAAEGVAATTARSRLAAVS